MNTNKKNGFICDGRKGLTLVELLVAMMVTSIILGCVGSLAYAMSRTNEDGEDMAEKQAHLRSATMRITDLIRHCRLICTLEENNISIWRADDNGDGRINLDELVYIGSDLDRDYVRVFEFYDDTRVLELNEIKPIVTGWSSYGSSTYRYTNWIPDCQNVVVAVDETPPLSKTAYISFDMEEGGVLHHYQITASLRSWAEHLLNDSGTIVTDDDENTN